MFIISNFKDEDPKFYKISLAKDTASIEYIYTPDRNIEFSYKDVAYKLEHCVYLGGSDKDDYREFANHMTWSAEPLSELGDFFAGLGFRAKHRIVVHAVSGEGKRMEFCITVVGYRYGEGEKPRVTVAPREYETVISLNSVDTVTMDSLMPLMTMLNKLSSYDQVVLYAVVFGSQTITEYSGGQTIIRPTKDLISDAVIEYLNSTNFMYTWE